jgi:hypothetical protein
VPTGAAGIFSREEICAECAKHLTEALAIPSSNDVLTSEGTRKKFLAHARQSRLMVSVGLFVLQCTGSHSVVISCTIHELFCPQVVLRGTWSETPVAQSQLTQFRQIPRHRILSYFLSTP